MYKSIFTGGGSSKPGGGGGVGPMARIVLLQNKTNNRIIWGIKVDAFFIIEVRLNLGILY